MNKDKKKTMPGKLPTETMWVRLGGDMPAFFEELTELGTVYIQTRTDCGGLGKFIDSSHLYFDEEQARIIEPEMGLVISVEELIAVFGCRKEATEMMTFEFDFATRPRGFSIYVLTGLSDCDHYLDLVARYFGQALSSGDLEQWRNDITPPAFRCHHCERAGEVRARNAAMHPVWDIFNDLIDTEATIYTRLLSDHSDLTCWSSPQTMDLAGGIISISDTSGGIISLEVRHVHSLVIRDRLFDGREWSSLEIYNSIGRQAFEFLTDDPSVAGKWIAFCERKRTNQS